MRFLFDNRWLCLTAGLLFLLASFSPPAIQAQSGSDDRPNIIFVFTDDHAYQALSAYGSEINETPNLDRLADEGTLFRRAFVTNSICAPSRAVVLTGKHSHLNGVTTNGKRFDGSQQTFPKLLQQAGYETAMIGKWHLGSDPTGFDYWDILPGQGSYYNPDMIRNGEREQHTGYVTDIITDSALNWLKNRRDEDKPFLLMYQHKAPHRAWQPPLDKLNMYDGEKIPEPETLFDDYEGRGPAAKWQAMTIARHMRLEGDLKLSPPGNLNEKQLEAWNEAYGPKNEAFREANLKGKELVRWKYQRYIKDYLRTVASVDDNMGRLLDYLEQSGLDENTVVVYSSDQGFYLGEHGWFDKRFMYKQSFRTPLLIRWPGVTEPGSETEKLVQNLDFAPTFLDMAGVEVPDDMQGRSLVPILKNSENTDWRHAVYYHYYEFPGWHDVRRHAGVRTGRYKLIHFYGIDEWELYDMQQDPKELNSVYDDPRYDHVVERLKGELERLRKKYRVPEYDEPPTPPDPRDVELQQVLRYDMERRQNQQVQDISGNDLHATLHQGTLTAERGGQVLKFEGTGSLALSPTPDAVDPTYRPLTVGAWIRPDAENGMILSHGDDYVGYSFYLDDGRPYFATNNRRILISVEGTEPIPTGEWSHVAATIDEFGQATIWINGERAGDVRTNLATDKPGDEFTIGADTGEIVTEEAPARHWEGALDDVRLYWGKLGEDALQEWAETR